MSCDEPSDTRIVLDTFRKDGKIVTRARPQPVPDNIRRAVLKHQLKMLAAEQNLFLGRIRPDALSVQRWMGNGLAHETRADGSCEKHCARCQLEGDPVIAGEKAYRKLFAA